MLCQFEGKGWRLSKYIITLVMIYRCLGNNNLALYYCDLAMAQDKDAGLENTYTSTNAKALKYTLEHAEVSADSCFEEKDKKSYAYKYWRFFDKATFTHQPIETLKDEFSTKMANYQIDSDGIHGRPLCQASYSAQAHNHWY